MATKSNSTSTSKIPQARADAAPSRLPDRNHIDSNSEATGRQLNRRGILSMATSLAGAAAATTISHASVLRSGPDKHARALQANLSAAIVVESEKDLWLALFRESCEAMDILWKADAAVEEAESEAEEEYPAQKNIRTWSLANNGEWYLSFPPLRVLQTKKLDRDIINDHYKKSVTSWDDGRWITADMIAKGNDYRRQSLASLEEWEKLRDEIDARHDIPSLREIAKGARNRHDTADRAIVETPARSMVGVAVKLAFWMATGDGQFVFDNPDEGQTDELAVMSAWRAAIALAGLPDDFGMEEHKTFIAERAARMAAL